MKPKLLTVILVLAALFSGVVLWRVDRFVYGDRMAWAEAQSRSQISSMTQALKVEIQSARRLLNSLGPETFQKGRTNWNGLQPYYALGLMTTQPGGGMSITQVVAKDGSPGAGWNVPELTKLIGFIGKELESRSAVILRAFKDSKKNRHVAIIFSGNGRAYILVGSGANFQALIESQRGSMSSFAIVAADGLTISHGTPEYVGTVMGDSAILKEIRTTGSAQGLGAYTQGQRKVFGMYEQVPGTNAYILSTIPMEELLKGRMSLAWQFVFLGLGFVLVGAALYFWFERQNATATLSGAMFPTMPTAPAGTLVSAPAVSVAPAKPAKPTEASPPPPPAPVPATASPSGSSARELPSVLSAPRPPKPAPINVNGPRVAPAAPVEKTEAYRQVAAALGQEMRAPLASILGFSQMVLAKTQDPEVVQAVDSILREARSSRDVLEKLFTFAGERDTKKMEAKMEGPIMQALKNLDILIQQKGVRVEKDFQATPPWWISSADLTKAFENLFANAIEAMERMSEKVLRIQLWEGGDGLHARVTDTGEGIEVENLEKVFDPFFTTRSYAQHVGLGLPVVAGILKEHQAKVELHSQRGKGTTVDIVFSRPMVSPSVAESASPVLKSEELPKDLPSAAAMKAAELPSPAPAAEVKLMDVNVDSLLDMGAEEAPLRFLEGQGFDDLQPPPPPPSAPPRLAAAPPPPPPTVEVPLVPPPPPTAPPSAVVIDPPAFAPPEKTSSSLGSYKVQIRRPGKRD